MRIAVLVKQVPMTEELHLGADGRLVRDAVEAEMNPYCRRAVAQAVSLVGELGGTVEVVTLGPPAAEDVLREAIAAGADHGVLITDPAFAGSDTLATADAVASVLRSRGTWDLVLCGRNSIDADTGQVGPQVAQLLDLPFASAVRSLAVDDGRVRVRCEHETGSELLSVTLPAVLAVAERLIAPAKRPPEARRQVPADRLTTLQARHVGVGPFGEARSRTVVGEVRAKAAHRQRRVDDARTLEQQVTDLLSFLRENSAAGTAAGEPAPVAGPAASLGAEPLAAPPARLEARADGTTTAASAHRPVIAVVLGPDSLAAHRHVVEAAGELARDIGGALCLLTTSNDDVATLGAAVDSVVRITGVSAADDVAPPLTSWARRTRPWAVLAPSTLWGRELLSRLAVDLDAGLVGDALGVEAHDGRLVCWKPAFNGRVEAAITTTSETQLATLRPAGGGPRAPQRRGAVPVETTLSATRRGRVARLGFIDNGDVNRLLTAKVVVGVGQGVAPEDYPVVERLRAALGAELCATRRVTDAGWLPRQLQVGLTGHSLAPDLYLGLGMSGRFNHLVGVSQAKRVALVTLEPTPGGELHVDLLLRADWRQVAERLLAELRAPAREPGPHVTAPEARERRPARGRAERCRTMEAYR